MAGRGTELATAYVSIIPSFDGMRRSIDKEFSGSGTQMEAAGRQAGGRFSAGMVAGLAAAGAAVGAFAVKSVQAFAEAETAQSRLDQAFASFPALADVNVTALREQAAALQEVTKYDGDLTNAAQAQLAAFDLTGQQIQAVTPLMLDLATAMGTDAAGAAQTIGRALMGNTRGLKAIGIDFQATGDRARDLATLMDLVSQKFGGFAQREGQTAAGQAAQLSNAFGDLQENIGAALLPALQALVNVAKPLLDVVKALPTPLVSMGLAFGGIVVATRLLGGNLGMLATGFSTIAGAVRNLPTVISSLGTAWQYAGQAATKAYGPTATLGQRMAEMARITAPGLQSKLGALASFIGGAWSAALIGATILMVAFAKSNADAEAAVANLKDTLNQQTGATTAATIAKISEALRGVMDADMQGRMEALGFSFKDLSNVVASGDPEALKKWFENAREAARNAGDVDLLNAIVDLQLAANKQQQALYNAQQAARDGAAAAADAGVAIDENTGAIVDNTDAADDNADAYGNASDYTYRYGNSVGYLGGILGNINTRLDESSVAAQANAEAMAAAAEQLQRITDIQSDIKDARFEARVSGLDDVTAATKRLARARKALKAIDQATDPEAWWTQKAIVVDRRIALDEAQAAATEAAADRAAEARKKLEQQAKELATSMKESLRGSITDVPNASIEGMTAGLKIRLSQIRKFAADLNELGRRGLPQWLLQQIVDAGIPDGAQVAATLARANGKEFATFSRAARQVNAAAGIVGNQQAQRITGYAPGPTSGMPSAPAVEVSVYIGNEQLNGHIDTRVATADQRRAQRNRAGRRYAS